MIFDCVQQLNRNYSIAFECIRLIRLEFWVDSVRLTLSGYYKREKADIQQSAPPPEREVSSCLGSYVVNLLDPNGKSDSYKMELELKYVFWNFFFRLIDTTI